MGSLDSHPSRESLERFEEPRKQKKDAEKNYGKEELETSAATSKPGAKLTDSCPNIEN